MKNVLKNDYYATNHCNYETWLVFRLMLRIFRNKLKMNYLKLASKKSQALDYILSFFHSDVNPYSWSAYTPCSVTCGIGKSLRYRLCSPNTENCPLDGYETEQISCYKPNCPGKKQYFTQSQTDALVIKIFVSPLPQKKR